MDVCSSECCVFSGAHLWAGSNKVQKRFTADVCVCICVCV